MKRILTILCLGLALTLTTAGCTRDKAPHVTPTPTTPAATATPSTSPVTTPGTNDGAVNDNDGIIGNESTNDAHATGTPGTTGTGGVAGTTIRPTPRTGTGRDIGNAAGDIVGGVGNAAGDIVNGVGNAARDIGTGVKDALH